MIVFTIKTPPPCLADKYEECGIDDSVHAFIMRNNEVPSRIINREYRFPGWFISPTIQVRRVPRRIARKLRRESTGFCGLEWTVKAIIDGKVSMDIEKAQRQMMRIYKRKL